MSLHNEEEFRNLFHRYLQNEVSPDEKKLVEDWFHGYNVLTAKAEESVNKNLDSLQKESWQRLRFKIKKQKRRTAIQRFSIAASVLLVIISGWYVLTTAKKSTPVKVASAISDPTHVLPGGNKATLTLASGQVIDLTKTATMNADGSLFINSISSGTLKYDKENTAAAQLQYNTLATPKGGKYQVQLSDGTMVWLNSISSITYPVVFGDTERLVELTGEAYFEVAHNAKKPFRVRCSGQTVEVLGTHFNIKAYADENAIKTTLLEGSVEVSSGSISRRIVPGEQASLFNNALSVREVNVDNEIAWKNGLFMFDNNDTRDVMKELSRWYDIDVQYEGNLPERAFSGQISMSATLSQILDILSFKKIKYRLESNTIILFSESH